MNQQQGKPIVGVSTAFTGKYPASQCIIRFLDNLHVDTIKSTSTKPDMMEAASTIASADYCLPLRVYIGHIYHLLQEHPEINVLVTPIIKGEHPASSTCAKYRDLDGVVIRSLGSITGYRLIQGGLKEKESFQRLLGEERTEKIIQKVERLPKIIAPEIESVEKSHLRQVCGKLYAELYGWNKGKLLRYLSSSKIADSSDPEFRRVEEAFQEAYKHEIEKESGKADRMLKDVHKPRLALVGRDYLIEDPSLSADIKMYFAKKGVAVITARDVPFSRLKPLYDKSNGFYDTHKLGQAFIDYIMDQVDGFIVIGSFGCHPDAFQVEYFANYITDRGKACWTFKFDEQTGGVGFHTRFETIISFLQQKRDERVQSDQALVMASNPDLETSKEVVLFQDPSVPWDYSDSETSPKKPVFIWPYMGSGIDLLLKEVWFQLGLDQYLYPPKPVNEVSIEKGNVHFTETCSPYALSMGNVRETLDRYLKEIEEETHRTGKKIEPRRIIILMARGKGPCTFGWYSIAAESTLMKEYEDVLQKNGHTLEMISIDNEGRNLISFLEELTSSAKNDRIGQLIKGLDQLQRKKRFKMVHTTKVEVEMIKLLKSVVWSGWKKLLAFEDLQNKALEARAHELTKGSTTKLLKIWTKRLEEAHTLPEIMELKGAALKEFDLIPRDHQQKPKVVIVGEIYVVLTSFANRGTVEHLLGSAGIEAVEGMRLSHFIRGAFKGLKNHYLHQQPLLKPIFKLLESKALYQPNAWVREPAAKPFLEHEIGGDGLPTVAHARHHIEQDGVDGVLHIYPFKCMPEGMAKDALDEMSDLYGIKSLHLSYDKELEIERLRTEIHTFAALLHQELDQKKNDENWRQKEIERRLNISKTIDKIYRQSVK